MKAKTSNNNYQGRIRSLSQFKNDIVHKLSKRAASKDRTNNKQIMSDIYTSGISLKPNSNINQYKISGNESFVVGRKKFSFTQKLIPKQ